MTDVIRAYQRAVVASAGLAVVGLVVLGVAGHVGFGMLLCMGVALGAANTALTHMSSLRQVRRPGDHRGVLLTAALRLAVVVATAIAFAVVFWPDGLAVTVGLAFFQLVLFAVTARTPGERPA